MCFLSLSLQDMIGDANPMVVANAVAALSEIQEISGRADVFTIDSNSLFKLLRALNECTEWGQVRLLACLVAMTLLGGLVGHRLQLLRARSECTEWGHVWRWAGDGLCWV